MFTVCPSDLVRVMEEFVQLKNKLWSVLLAVGGPLALGRGAIRQDDCWLKWGPQSCSV